MIPDGLGTGLYASQALPSLTQPSAQSPAVLSAPGSRGSKLFPGESSGFPFCGLGCKVLSPPRTGNGTCWQNLLSGQCMPLQPPGGCLEPKCGSVPLKACSMLWEIGLELGDCRHPGGHEWPLHTCLLHSLVRWAGMRALRWAGTKPGRFSTDEGSGSHPCTPSFLVLALRHSTHTECAPGLPGEPGTQGGSA